MRRKHRRTLARVHQRPPAVDIRWEELLALLEACDVEVGERSGARVGLRKEGERIVIHRPHPSPNVGRPTVRDVSAFLQSVGVGPEDS